MQRLNQLTLLLFFTCIYSEFAMAQTCTLTAGSSPVAFGAFNPFQATPITGINQIMTISCTGDDVSITYTLEATAGGGGTYSPYRTMLRGGVGPETLQYNLYLDPAYTTYWGLSPTNSFNASGHCRAASPCTHTAFGVVPAPQPTVRGGTYSATITATLTYH